MFPYFGLSSIIEAVSKLPKEIIVAGVGAYVVLEIHDRNTQVKLEEAKARNRCAELEVEALKLKLKLQEKDHNTETP